MSLALCANLKRGERTGKRCRWPLSRSTSTFPNSHVGKKSASPTDTPSGPGGQELVVELTLCGRNFVGLNGGPKFVPNEAVSFMILTDDQAETDRVIPENWSWLFLLCADRAPPFVRLSYR